MEGLKSDKKDSAGRLEKSYCGRQLKEREVVPEVSASSQGKEEQYSYYIKLDDPPCKQCPECSPPKSSKAKGKP